MNSKSLNALSSILFHTEKVDSTKIAPGFQFKSKDAYSIVGYPEGGKVVLNTCSDKYNIIKNEEVLMPLMELVENQFDQSSLRVLNEDDARFQVSIVPRKQKAVLDEILPRFQFNNSYDGTVKATLSGGLYRTVCENGAAIPVKGKTFTYSFKHNDREILMPETWEQITLIMQTFIHEFPAIEDSINKMKSVKIEVGELTKVLETIASASNLFPKKGIAKAFERAQIESVMLKEPMNLWLAYNGLNYVLNHDREDLKIVQHVRNSIDEKLIEKTLAMV